MAVPSSVPLYFPATPNPTSAPSHLLLELPTEILKMIDQQTEDKPLSCVALTTPCRAYPFAQPRSQVADQTESHPSCAV